MCDLNSFSATDAQKFFDEYYIPSNMVVAVVGDVKAATAMPVIEKYFGRIPSHEKPEEAPPPSHRRTPSAPWYCMSGRSPFTSRAITGPTTCDKDDAVYDAIADLMSEGRTSRLYRTLVRDKKIASVAAGFTGFPGVKYPHLFAFFAFPLPGHTPQEIADSIHAEIDRLKKEDISDEELKMIKTRAKANLLRGLADNEGLASQLAQSQSRYGDWRELFRKWSASTQYARPISAASPTRFSCRPTAPWALSKHSAAARERRSAMKRISDHCSSDVC